MSTNTKSLYDWLLEAQAALNAAKEIAETEQSADLFDASEEEQEQHEERWSNIVDTLTVTVEEIEQLADEIEGSI